MQSNQEPSSILTWLRLSRAVLLGILLGLVQAGLFFLLVGDWFNNYAWSAIGIAAFFYLLIPALEGFLSARRNADAYEGVGAGCLVGGISIPACVIGAIAAIVWILHTESSVCTSDCYTRIPFLPIDPSPGSVASLIFAVVIGAGIGGLGGGFIGGWLGGILRQKFAHTRRRAAAPRQARHSETRHAAQAPDEKRTLPSAWADEK